MKESKNEKVKCVKSVLFLHYIIIILYYIIIIIIFFLFHLFFHFCFLVHLFYQVSLDLH